MSNDASLTTVTCPHCGDVTEQRPPLLAEYVCGRCDQPFAGIPITEAMIEAGVDAYVKFYGERDCWKYPDAIVFSNGIAAAYRAMEAARAK